MMPASRAFGLLLLACALVAGEVTVTTAQTRRVSDEPLVTVNGSVITLGDLELTLLRQEGADLIQNTVKQEMENKDWAALGDHQNVLAQPLTKGRLILELLRLNGVKVRSELIDIRLVEQAMEKKGVVCDQRAIDAELARMQKRMDQGLVKRGKQRADLRSVIQNQYGMSLERWVQQKGFRMLLGLHALLDLYAADSISDAEIADYVKQHPERFRTEAAVDLSVLFFAYPTTGPEAGRNDHANILAMMTNLRNEIRKGTTSFDEVWKAPLFDQAMKRVYPDAKAGGRIGWVLPHGQTEQGEGRGVHRKTIELAFAAQGPWPQLLEPVAADDGVELAMAHGRRAASEPVLTEIAAEVRRDIIDDSIDKRQKTLMEDLRKVAVISYADLTALIKARAAELRQSGAQPPSP